MVEEFLRYRYEYILAFNEHSIRRQSIPGDLCVLSLHICSLISSSLKLISSSSKIIFLSCSLRRSNPSCSSDDLHVSSEKYLKKFCAAKLLLVARLSRFTKQFVE